MRAGGIIILAAVLTALSASGAKAEEWCGYAIGTIGNNTVIECGYTTAAHCENSVGKRGLCFVDPDLALRTKRAMHLPRHPGAMPPLSRENG